MDPSPYRPSQANPEPPPSEDEDAPAWLATVAVSFLVSSFAAALLALLGLVAGLQPELVVGGWLLLTVLGTAALTPWLLHDDKAV